jgi:hypothetical protein
MKFRPAPSPYRNIRIWNAKIKGFSFVITQELLPGDEEFTGFTASWKNSKADMLPFGKQPANRIDGGPWNTFEEAEKACEYTLHNLLVLQ